MGIRESEKTLNISQQQRIMNLPCCEVKQNGKIIASADDREFLKHINQKTSIIVSSITGVNYEYESNLFEDF